MHLESPLVVCLTGAAGQIAYALLPALCDGSIFGAHAKIDLRLLDITPMMSALKGVIMELEDCAWPNLCSILATDDPIVAFQGCDVAVLVGAMPRREGMERKDLLKANAGIFKVQGEALNSVAKKSVKVLVVGNPANTNAYIVSHYAHTISKQNFSALTRLDDNRARSLLAGRLGVDVTAVRKTIIWGNHSNTQYPDVSQAQVRLVNGQVLTGPEIIDEISAEYYETQFMKTVQTRGAAVIAARKLSSAMSAAKAIGDHLRDWIRGTMGPEEDWVSMAVYSTASGYPAIPDDLFFSLPVTCKAGHWTVVPSLALPEATERGLERTVAELISERNEALAFLGKQ